jgi:VCBS repeat-containing protein
VANLTGVEGSSAAWGDYDNDGDLDLLLAGWTGGRGITKIYQNNTSTRNTPPAAPSNLQAAVTDQQVTLSWQAATDAQTPASGLSYNVYVGTSPGNLQKVSPQADIGTGYRRIPALGNGQSGTSFWLQDLPHGTYYWSVQAVDGAFAGSPFASEASFTVGTPVNTNPVATNDAYQVNEDQTLTIAADLGVLRNDTDADGNTLTAAVVPESNVTHGSLKLNADGSFTYTPAANYNGEDAFTYTLSDGEGGTATATVTITVNAVNDAPSFTLASSSVLVNEDAGDQTVNNFATNMNDGDPELDQSLTFTITGNSNSALFSVAPAISSTGTLTYTPAANVTGSAFIQITLSDNGSATAPNVNTSPAQSFTITVTPVNDAPIVNNNGATQQVQYSDPITAVTITATDADQDPLTATTAWQQSGDASFTNGLPAGLSLTAGNPYSWTLGGKIGVAPGTYTIRVTVGDGTGDAANNTGYSDITIEVKPENAVADYTGAQAVATSSATSGTALLTLSATLRDITAVTSHPLTDASAGDIRKAKVRFLLDNAPVINTTSANGALTDGQGWTTVSLVNATDLKTGTVLVKVPVNIGTADAQQYTLRVEVSEYYTAEEETQVINVYKPLNDFVTGGGYIVSTKSSGTYASDAGRKTNFGFNVKYNKSGKSLQGTINTIFRRKESDGLVHVYQIKGNSMTSLSVNTKVATAKTAIFNGKANLQDITNPQAPVSLGGNLTLQVSMTDKGEPGKNDLLGITVFSNSGGILYSSNWDGVKTAEMLLSGGNILINSGSVTTGTTTNTKVSSVKDAGGPEVFTAPEPTLTAYPNPTTDKATIQFSFAQDEDYTIAIYDLKGALVKQLPSGKAKATELRQVDWQVEKAPVGMYIARITTASSVQQLKLLVK